MTNIPSPPTVPLLDNLGSADVFADAATGWLLFNGNIRITFESVRSSYGQGQPSVSRVVIGRLVMPIDQAEQMAKGLLEFIKQKREQVSTEPAQGTPTIN